MSERAYRAIKDQIISLSLRPGAQADEAVLARELALGRTPIREALLRLAAEGMVEAVPGRGYFVRSVGLDDVKSLFEAMLIQERPAVILAARRRKKEHLDRLRELNRQIKAAMAARDFLAVTRLNSDFHRVFYRATNNGFIFFSLNLLQNQAQRLAYLCFSQEADPATLEEHYVKVNQDHDDLIRHLETGDESALVETITRHIDLFHDRVARYTSPALTGLRPYLAPAEERTGE